MLQVQATIITPDDTTEYLVGPEGLVWTQPAFGKPYIVAARNEQEKQRATEFIGELLQMRLVPYGLPLNQKATRAMFGGSPIRDCQWVPFAEAPANGLPTNATVAVIT